MRKGQRHTLESRRKMSEALRGENHPNWGKKLSLETRQKISKACQGKKRSPETCRRISEAQRGKQRGKDNANWKGGRYKDIHGYVLIWNPNHPNANKQGYVREHRLVMVTHLGRPLRPGEIVHHKNGINDDNRIENLELLPRNIEHVAINFATNARILALEEGLQAQKAKTRRWMEAYFRLLVAA